MTTMVRVGILTLSSFLFSLAILLIGSLVWLSISTNSASPGFWLRLGSIAAFFAVGSLLYSSTLLFYRNGSVQSTLAAVIMIGLFSLGALLIFGPGQHNDNETAQLMTKIVLIPVTVGEIILAMEFSAEILRRLSVPFFVEDEIFHLVKLSRNFWTFLMGN